MSGKSLKQLLHGIAVVNGDDPTLTSISMDSRQVQAGGLFLACSGIAGHGLAFVDDAMQRGAAYVLWEPDQRVAVPEGKQFLAVPDLAKHAGEIASRFFENPSATLHVTGCTGTNGKTSVTQIVAQAFENTGQACGIVGTLGSGRPGHLRAAELTTPDAVSVQSRLAELRAEGCQQVAMEVSSHALDQGRVNGTQFRQAVFTNLTRDHLDYHGNLDAYRAAKQHLFEFPELHTAIANSDDPAGIGMLQASSDKTQRIAFGTRDFDTGQTRIDTVIRTETIESVAAGLRLTLRVNADRLSLEVPLFGRFNALNVMAALGVLLAEDIGLETSRQALTQIRAVLGRMERISSNNSATFIVDYAHSPDALAHALQAARAHCSGRLWCVFGCGGDRDRGKRPLMGKQAESLADVVLLTDDNPRTEDPNEIVREILTGIQQPDAVTVMHDRAAALEFAVANTSSGDVVLVAGKGHEDYQIVGTDKREFSDQNVLRELLGAVA